MATKITDAHEEQIRNMRADDKKYREIRDFFKDKYKMTIYDSDIARACRKTKKKPRAKKIIEVTPVKIQDEVAKHIIIAYQLYKKDFLRKVETTIGNI